MIKHIILLVFLSWMVTGCTTIPPIQHRIVQQQAQVFSHQDFDEVLHQYVNDDGRVDYKRLKAAPEQFERYYHQIATYSPDSNPELFSTQADQLAYWINAYNAAVIKTVLSYYPVNSVEDVKPPLPLFFLPDKTGFFLFQKPTFGQTTTSLYYLENSIIRERFQEPRIHFALNCASLGCPKLPRYAFNGDLLNQQLEFETRKFFSETRNFKIDHATKTIFLSSILDWYDDDFIDWYTRHFPDKQASLLKYVALYVDDNQADFLNNRSQDYSVSFVTYDWALNDQK